MSGTKDKSKIPCYYETQPSGCQKNDCPYLHSQEGTHSINGESELTTQGSDPIVDDKEEEVSTGVDPQISSSQYQISPSTFTTKTIPTANEKKEIASSPAGNALKRKVITIETRKSAETVAQTQTKNNGKPELRSNPPTAAAQVRVNLSNSQSKSNASKLDHRKLPSPSLEEEKPSFGVKSFVQIISEKKEPESSSGTKRLREDTLHPSEPSAKVPRQESKPEIVKPISQPSASSTPERSNLTLSEDQLDLEYEESLLNGDDGETIDDENIDLDEELAAAGVL